MKKIYYISASTLPSRSANSIHVINMAKSLSENHSIEIYARTNIFSDRSKLHKKISEFYNLSEYTNLKIKLVYYPFPRFIELAITLYFLFLNFNNIKKSKINKLISRNLFCSFILSFLNNKVSNIYETHSPERGIRSFFQNFILKNENSIIVVISDALKNILIQKYKLSYIYYKNIYCFHDAAPIENIKFNANKNTLIQILSERKISTNSKLIGYFGNLYTGRGQNLIKKLAKNNPELIFFIFGSKSNQSSGESNDDLQNLIYQEFVPPHKIISLMKSMDILLMPYEEKVYLSDGKNETSKWMSPIKMFEYMSSGVPFISSKISVLEEVLVNNFNCLLAEPNDENDWSKKINWILNNPKEAKILAKNSFDQFKNEYNWNKRSFSMISIKKLNDFNNFINYVVESKIFSKGLMFFSSRYRIFTKNYIKGNFKFYIYQLFGGINFKNKNVLDIGSGTGIFSIYASFAGANHISSLEPEDEGSSERMLENFFDGLEPISIANVIFLFLNTAYPACSLLSFINLYPNLLRYWSNSLLLEI